MMVSVLMPVYNSQEYLHQAIESILDQSFSDFEFLIYDDGSTDNSPEIIRSYAEKDSRIIFQSLEHHGYSPLLNLGVKEAKGHFIARMDSDDIALPTRLEKQVKFLEDHPDHVAVGCQAIRIDPDGDPIGYMSFDTSHTSIDHSQIYLAKGLMLHPGTMIHKDALIQIGAYRTEFEPGEDFDLFIRLAEVGKLANLQETLMHYRTHLKNITITKKEKHQEVKQRALTEAYRRRGLDAEVPEIKLIDTPNSVSENHFIWMHMAMSSGFYRTAQKHAYQGLKKSSKQKKDFYNYIQGLLGPLTRALKSWKARL